LLNVIGYCAGVRNPAVNMLFAYLFLIVVRCPVLAHTSSALLVEKIGMILSNVK